MLILIKLLATSNVANNFLGRSSNFVMSCAFEVFISVAKSMSFGVSEKKATSAPDMIAVQKSNKIIPVKPRAKWVSMVSKRAKLGGSRSNGYRISLTIKTVNRFQVAHYENQNCCFCDYHCLRFHFVLPFQFLSWLSKR